MIGWCSRNMAERGQCGSNGRIHADPTCTRASDPTVLVEVRDGLLFPTMRESKGIRVVWCKQCERPAIPGAWADHAACAGSDWQVFFPSTDGPTRSVTAAKRVCARCPVWGECLDYAIRHKMDYGVWGGAAPKMRRRAVTPDGRAKLRARLDRIRDGNY